MPISQEDVHNIAALAHLEFDEPGIARMTTQLNSILEYMDKLNELDTTSVDTTYHPITYPDVFREDEVRESLPVDKVLQNAPEKTWQYFVVPKVVG